MANPPSPKLKAHRSDIPTLRKIARQFSDAPKVSTVRTADDMRIHELANRKVVEVKGLCC